LTSSPGYQVSVWYWHKNHCPPVWGEFSFVLRGSMAVSNLVT